MKKIYLSISVLFVTFFAFTINVKANSINSIDMDIYIDSNGNAYVTETWNAYLNQGTEGYKPYSNLGDSTITDFTVSNSDKNFESIDYWDVNASFSSKAYKSGIVEKSDGVELCWGISHYGSNTYILKYKINNFIYKTSDDYQLLYWNLIPPELSSKPKQVKIKIYADSSFENNLDVWGYGNYGGTAYVYNGVIEMNSDGELDSNEYMTLLVKFSKDTFNVTTENLDMTFDEYKKMADEGSKKYKKGIGDIIISILGFVFEVFIWVIILVAIFKTNKNTKYGTKRLCFGKSGKKLTKKYEYYRDLPCNKDLFRAYWVACSYGLIKKKENFLGAILLKWVKNGVVKLDKSETGSLFKRENTNIVFESADKLTNNFEKELYSMMYEASKDGILESKEFENWCNKHYSKILKWFDNIIDAETEKLVLENKCIINEKKVLGITISNTYEVDSSMKEEAEQLLGLKKFLTDFSNLSKSYPIEVHMWEEYLMFAQIFGIADKVAKEFKKIYPDVITDMSVSQVAYINNVSYRGMNKALSARDRANSYSSGGGGFSSGGGGGGSFGSSSGGGFR